MFASSTLTTSTIQGESQGALMTSPSFPTMIADGRPLLQRG